MAVDHVATRLSKGVIGGCPIWKVHIGSNNNQICNNTKTHWSLVQMLMRQHSNREIVSLESRTMSHKWIMSLISNLRYLRINMIIISLVGARSMCLQVQPCLWAPA